MKKAQLYAQAHNSRTGGFVIIEKKSRRVHLCWQYVTPTKHI